MNKIKAFIERNKNELILCIAVIVVIIIIPVSMLHLIFTKKNQIEKRQGDLKNLGSFIAREQNKNDTQLMEYINLYQTKYINELTENQIKKNFLPPEVFNNIVQPSKTQKPTESNKKPSEVQKPSEDIKPSKPQKPSDDVQKPSEDIKPSKPQKPSEDNKEPSKPQKPSEDIQKPSEVINKKEIYDKYVKRINYELTQINSSISISKILIEDLKNNLKYFEPGSYEYDNTLENIKLNEDKLNESLKYKELVNNVYKELENWFKEKKK